ncbi:antibiotic biosynthesis monooxygenase family protein [Nonomuraea sp. NPDC003804]|uniref:antibiotic biosynthesis monooxygenase family protein n=1 Tax=Nonomuraea sp. NPDC003804 TaxID=3154547 RepID=UPI0033AD3DFF
MTRIAPEDAHFTMVNIFTTTPEHQEQLFDVMSQGAEVMGRHPGCVSVSMHLSHDGTRLISLTEWRTKDDFDAMRARSDLQKYFKEVSGIITSVDPNPCRVAYSSDVAHQVQG